MDKRKRKGQKNRSKGVKVNGEEKGRGVKKSDVTAQGSTLVESCH